MKQIIFLITFLITFVMNGNTQIKTQKWDKNFSKSDQVRVEKVSFKNHYDIIIVAAMYLPKKLNC